MKAANASYNVHKRNMLSSKQNTLIFLMVYVFRFSQGRLNELGDMSDIYRCIEEAAKLEKMGNKFVEAEAESILEEMKLNELYTQTDDEIQEVIDQHRTATEMLLLEHQQQRNDESLHHLHNVEMHDDGVMHEIVDDSSGDIDEWSKMMEQEMQHFQKENPHFAPNTVHESDGLHQILGENVRNKQLNAKKNDTERN